MAPKPTELGLRAAHQPPLNIDVYTTDCIDDLRCHTVATKGRLQIGELATGLNRAESLDQRSELPVRGVTYAEPLSLLALTDKVSDYALRPHLGAGSSRGGN